jgi:hypothetical protein
VLLVECQPLVACNAYYATTSKTHLNDVPQFNSQSSVARSGTGSGSNTVDGSEENPNTSPFYPLWVHVTRYNMDGSESRGKDNSRFKCHFCDGVFMGSYSRVRAHLLKIAGVGTKSCTKISYSVLEKLRKKDESSSSIWKTYSFVRRLKRNMLTTKRAEDLVLVHIRHI